MDFAKSQHRNISMNIASAVILIPLRVHVVLHLKDLHLEIYAEAYSEHCETSKMECISISAKRSILDV